MIGIRFWDHVAWIAQSHCWMTLFTDLKLQEIAWAFNLFISVFLKNAECGTPNTERWMIKELCGEVTYFSKQSKQQGPKAWFTLHGQRHTLLKLIGILLFLSFWRNKFVLQIYQPVPKRWVSNKRAASRLSLNGFRLDELARRTEWAQKECDMMDMNRIARALCLQMFALDCGRCLFR